MDKLRNFLIFLSVSFLMLVAAYIGYILAFKDLILPRTSIAGVEVTGMDRQSALRLVTLYFQKNPSHLRLRYNGKENDRFDNFKVEYDYIWAVDQAMSTGRSGNILTRLKEQSQILFNQRDIQLPARYDADELEGILDELETQINQEPVWPKLVINNGDVVLEKGKNGLTVNRALLKDQVIKALSTPSNKLLDVPMEVVVTQESDEQANKALQSAKKWLNKSLVLKTKDSSVQLSADQVINLFGLVSDPISSRAYENLVNELRPKIETDPKDAVFSFENNKVIEFKPEVIGAKIDTLALKDKLAEVIYKDNVDSLDIPLILSYPKITTGEINNLGIKELIGKGTSKFAHSIPGRVFNVNLASSRINGVIVPPGEVFSFNDNVGEISRETGYQSAYIISGGRTVLGDGGGVCQVSTTVFRAAMNAGLPITERKAHAYRVGYYEQDSKPGLDATVFSPSADLKFKNDTGNHILILTHVDTKNLTMSVEIYGTSDGRKSFVSDSRVSDQTPPPPTMYVDDPTLPSGTTKQIDWSAWGAKVSFDYKVERGGEVLFSKTFYSNYQPWQAIYLKGTKI